MARFVVILFLKIFLFLGGCFSVYGVSCPDNLEFCVGSSFPKGFRFTVVTQDSLVYSGETLRLSFSFENKSSESFIFPVDRYSDFYGFDLDIRNSKGEKVKLPQSDTPGVESLMAMIIEPGEKFEGALKINNLTVDSYSIIISHYVGIKSKDRKKKEIVRFKSETIYFQILEKSKN